MSRSRGVHKCAPPPFMAPSSQYSVQVASKEILRLQSISALFLDTYAWKTLHTGPQSMLPRSAALAPTGNLFVVSRPHPDLQIGTLDGGPSSLCNGGFRCRPRRGAHCFEIFCISSLQQTKRTALMGSAQPQWAGWV